MIANKGTNLIKKLDGQTVQRISSGQVIISMATAVKELIENALDAGASCVTIRFVDHGKEIIEVIDNGTGIEENNFELLGRRNCTSKLLEFDHLNLVQTFGFRGEALNSLCNLADVKIHTKHSNQAVGTVLTFDTNGKIIRKESKVREIGTTVTLSQLFRPLPVRRKEFLINIRRSFDKTLSLIYQYCLGMIGFKIICSHMKNNSGTYSTIFTNNGISIQSNIIEIFDYKQFSQLIPFTCNKDISNNSSNLPNKVDFDITGYISKPDTGCGRSLSDRQYFYINGRPCDLPTISKKINQLYRNYNRNQYPFVLLKITFDQKLVDRNLTPDKRKILIADNHYLLKVIEHSIGKMFSPESNEILSLSQSKSNMSSFLKRELDDKETKDNFNMSKISKNSLSMELSFEKPSSNISENFNDVNTSKQIITFDESNKFSTKPLMHPFFQTVRNCMNTSEKNSSNKIVNYETAKNNLNSVNAKCEQQNQNLSNALTNQDNKKEDKNTNDDDSMTVITINNEEIASRKSLMINTSIDEICQQYKQHMAIKTKFAEVVCSFQAKIKPEDNEQALKELKHSLSKQSFTQMRIIGQFNLGFIITELNRNLFIIDQHAIDERFNYEKYLNNPEISHQNLVCPLDLKLSAMNEMVVMDNLDVFKKFGFDILIDHNADIGQRVKLLRIPIGKEWNAGKSDVEELINAIRDSPSNSFNTEQNFLFTKLKREIAYKACRSSVMIGEFLNKIQMKLLLSKIVNVKDPWHCAHNRPTIRHLISLDQFLIRI